MRELQWKPREAKGEIIYDPVKMVADDVILVTNSQDELQNLLDVCTKWALRNRLQWKPAKCVVVMVNPEGLTSPLTAAGQALSTSPESKYLGIIIKQNGSTEELKKEVEQKFRAACTAITAQSFFGPSFSNSTIRTLYHTKLRIILL